MYRSTIKLTPHLVRVAGFEPAIATWKAAVLTPKLHPQLAVLTGFEPATSSVTGKRALHTAPQDHLVTRMGFEPMYTRLKTWGLKPLVERALLCCYLIDLALPTGIEPVTLGRQPSMLPLHYGSIW